MNFSLNPAEKIALVGPNGSGKSTLLKIIAGILDLDQGQIHLVPGTRVGLLSQDPKFDDELSVERAARAGLDHLRQWEEQMHRLEARMAATPPGAEATAVIEEYGRLRSRFEAAGGYSAAARVRQVLFGVGFTAADLVRPCRVLSGGQRVRLGLARLLLTEPDLLLLDEPTNHLDLPATEWLEEYLRLRSAAVIIVSHDRHFLDAVTSKTLELEGGQAIVYPVAYSGYLVQRRQRLEQQHDLWRRQQEEAEILRAYIRRYMGGNRTTMAKSRQKKLARMEFVERPQLQSKSMGLQLNIRQQTGDQVLRLEGLTHAFTPAAPLFTDINLAVRRGERVALIGPNGSGKTTILKIIHGLVSPVAGQVWWGAGVERGYFSQDLDQVSNTNTVLDEMLSLPGMTIFSARSLLARFLFVGDDVMLRSVAALSGGERNRLILARLMLGGANVLLLDEPTNHLDLDSKQVLEAALIDYPGTLLFVSHDRYFIDRLATRVWEFTGSDLHDYAGNYSEYRQAKALAKAVPDATAAASAARGVSPAPRQSRARERARRSERRAAIGRLEDEISSLEQRKAELAELLSDPDTYRQPDAGALAMEFQAAEAELVRLYAEWEAMAAEEV